MLTQQSIGNGGVGGLCEACERAPAAFLCKADAASLCTACDADIHSANPLASRHHRVPIQPVPGSCLYGASQAQLHYKAGPNNCWDGSGVTAGTEDLEDDEDDEDEAASWLLLNPANNNNQNNGLFPVEEYLDLMEYNSCIETQFNDKYNYNNIKHPKNQYHVPHKNYGGGDSVVPVQSKEQLHQKHNFNLGMEYNSSKAYNSYNGSINRNVSVSSIDVLVPNPTTSDISISHPRQPKGTIDLFLGPPGPVPTQLLTPMDREARVMRYREKKKTRKFEKTIRYASRKAYAETRPRVKGRFAKRTDVDNVEVELMFSTTMVAECGYGIVPSF